MKNQMLEYKGFKGSVDHDLTANLLHGRLLFIRDLVTYEADNLPELKKEFQYAVDDYVADCQEDGIDPCKPCSGTMQIRMSPETHQKVQESAYTDNLSANAWINEAINEKLISNNQLIEHRHIHEHKITVELDTVSIWEDKKPTHQQHLSIVK